MMYRPTRRILLQLIADGGAPVVVFDIDEFRRFVNCVGEPAAADALAKLKTVLEEAAARSNGHVYFVAPDRFMVTLLASRYEEAVAFAARRVDDMRALALHFSDVPTGLLSVTAVVVSVETSVDVDRFAADVDDLLRDGKATGGDVVIRDR